MVHQERSLEVDRDVRLRYQVVETADKGAPAMVLANGLGGRAYSWKPVIDRFQGEYRLLSWDYRGLFGSTAPADPKGLSIANHSRDILAILDHEGIERATFVGWSMGVQVSLETALAAPDRVERLVLLNGTYGHVFQTGLQPLLRLPGFPPLLHSIVEGLVGSPRRAKLLQAVVRGELHLRTVGILLRLWRDNPEIPIMYRQYVEDVFGGSFDNYLKLFQELDAHSVYHLLPSVTQPTLVVSGGLDWLTPSRMSRRIAKRIPNADHLHFRLGSHFAIVEYPERLLQRMERFLG